MSAKKVKVLFCTDGIFPHAVGGMQRHSLLLIEKLASYREVELSVVHPHKGISVFNNPAINEIVIAENETEGNYLRNCYKYSKKVYDIIESNPDAVVYSQGLSVWHNIGKIGNRVIINPHGLESFQTISMRDFMIGIPFRYIFTRIFRNSRKVISLGGRLTGILHKAAGSDRVIVLPNAVNVPAETARTYDKSPLQFMFVGRFALNKGINILAQAVQQLNQEGYADKLVFNLVGKGPLFETYTKQYSFPNLNFLGFADDDKLNELYRTNDVFVLPTLFEGMPTVVLEAMAHGMPIIVTDVGATLEIVDKSNGFIIEKESVDSLKAAILSYLNMPEEKRALLSAESYRKVKEKFTWDIVARKHLQLFKEISDSIK